MGCCREVRVAQALERRGHADLAEQLIHAAIDPRELRRFETLAAEKPAAVERYYKECMEGKAAKAKPMDRRQSYCSAIAWSIYCKYKKTDSPHCKQTEYLSDQGS